MPYLSSLAIDANGFMIAHVGWQGLAMLVAYLAVGVAADPNIASPPRGPGDGEEGGEDGGSSNSNRGKSGIKTTILNRKPTI